MSVDAYIICWNEASTIHLTISHYKKICRNIYILDNFSNDGTREICEKMGCIVSFFGTLGVLDDREYLRIKNNIWKGSDADWVIVCDADEILDINIHLLEIAYQQFETIFKTNGWNIFSNDVPLESWSEITTGLPDKKYSKLVCFNPKEIKEINYVYGCHEAKPEGKVWFCELETTLFHYKHIGGAKRVADRHALYASRMSEWNKRYKCGYQYLEPRDQTIKYFNECLSKSVPFSQAGF